MNQSIKLHYKTFGQPENQPLLIFHGLFGLLDNWSTLARTFSQEYFVITADLRNHGRSPHTEPFNYSLLAQDIVELINDLSLKNPILIGHSMGGKAVMQTCLDYPDLCQKVIVVDIAPKAYPIKHDQIITALQSLDLPSLQSRQEAEDALALHLTDWGVRQFLLKNLYRDENNQFQWRMNLGVLAEKMPQIVSQITGKNKLFHSPALFIKGDRSDYIELPQDQGHILELFPMALFETIADCGHWVHAEKPQAFYQVVKKFLG